MGGVLMPITDWYTWPTKADFNVWHDGVVQALHLPRIGNNAATGQPDPTAQATTAYTDVVEVAADDWRAPVEPNIAIEYADGMGEPSQPPPYPEELLHA